MQRETVLCLAPGAGFLLTDRDGEQLESGSISKPICCVYTERFPLSEAEAETQVMSTCVWKEYKVLINIIVASL